MIQHITQVPTAHSLFRIFFGLVAAHLLAFSALPAFGQIEGLEMDEPTAGGPPPATVEIASSIEEPIVVYADRTTEIEVRYDFPDGFHQTKQEDMFTVSVPAASPVRIESIRYPTGVEEEGLINYYGEATLELSLRASPDVRPGEYRIPVTASYQLCDEAGTCFFPQEENGELLVRVVASSGESGSESGSTAGGAPSTGGGSAGTGGGSAGTSAGGGISPIVLLRYLFFAFIGGILLNVMPCVLPVLSIRALNLVKQSKNNHREIFIGSLLYSAGIILSLTALAAVVTVLKFSGELVGWGFQFQNPGFVVFLSAVVFVFALSLFDVYIFQAPTMGGAVQRAGEKGYLGSFFNGIIAVLLATPCTAPLLGTALGFAFSQPPLVIFGMFILVGLGFALPFLLIGIWPSTIQRLPKPGAWMNTFKELMGFVLLATVLYLLTILQHQLSTAGLLRVITFLLFLGFLLWIYGKASKPSSSRKRKWIILGIFIILTVSAADRILVLEPPTQEETAASLREGWETFEPERLEEYRDEGKPVFVVFSAKWCTVCTLNDKTVLHTEAADSLFEERNIQVLYGDFTNEDPLIEEWIRSYGRAGVPVYAYYPPDGESYELLPEVLTQDLLKKRLR